MLPPLGLGAMLPVACRRCIHLIAELGLTSNQSAASRRDAPDSTASTTRSRNSKEHGFGIDPPSRIRINAARFNYPSLPGNPDSTQPKSALDHGCFQSSAALRPVQAFDLSDDSFRSSVNAIDLTFEIEYGRVRVAINTGAYWSHRYLRWPVDVLPLP